jgi:hypothetical protein
MLNWHHITDMYPTLYVGGLRVRAALNADSSGINQVQDAPLLLCWQGSCYLPYHL